MLVVVPSKVIAWILKDKDRARIVTCKAVNNARQDANLIGLSVLRTSIEAASLVMSRT